MDVPYFPIGRGIAPLRSEILQNFGRVLDSGTFIGGEEVAAVETAIAERFALTWCVGVASGLDALKLAIEAVGVGPGDEVIVPAQTFVATWLSVVQAGAKPVPCDVNETSGLMDVASMQAVCGPNTVGIVPVHLHGQSADMDGICDFASRTGLWVIDDAAQSHGDDILRHAHRSCLKATAYSFYPSKNLGGLGDGGAVCTFHEDVASGVRRLGNYGRDGRGKPESAGLGWNSRLDPLQASAIGLFLRHLEEWNHARREFAAMYLELLGPLADEGLVSMPDASSSVWHHFAIQVSNRDRIQASLTAAGVETNIHYRKAPVEMPFLFEDAGEARRMFPAAVAHAERTLSLPMHPWLSVDEITYVTSSLHAALMG